MTLYYELSMHNVYSDKCLFIIININNLFYKY